MAANYAKKISSRIRQLRGFCTQGEFAQELGIPFRTYQRYESGTRVPPIKFIVKLADIKGVSADWILTGASSRTNGEGSSDEGHSIRPMKIMREDRRRGSEMPWVDSLIVGKSDEDLRRLLIEAKLKRDLWPRTQEEQREGALRLKALGCPSREIAAILGIGRRTIERFIAKSTEGEKAALKKDVLDKLEKGYFLNVLAREYKGQVSEQTIRKWSREKQSTK